MGAYAFFSRYGGQQKNNEYQGSLWFQTNFPKYERFLHLRYQAYYGGFSHINPFYYSYREQFEQIFESGLHFELCPSAYADFIYQRGYVYTSKLNNPINTIDLLNKRQNRTNTLNFLVSKRFGTRSEFRVDTEYYWDSQHYQAFSIQSSLDVIF